MNVKVELNQIEQYLLSKGWKFIDFTERLQKIKKVVNKEEIEIKIPKVQSIYDYEGRVDLLFETLSNIEKRDYQEIINAIQDIGYDKLKIAFTSEMTSKGNFPFLKMTKAIENVERIIKNAIQSEIHPKPKFLTLYNDTINLLEHSHFGQTEVGSYVFQIKLPLGYIYLLDEGENEQIEEKDDFLNELGRRSILRLIEGLNCVKKEEFIGDNEAIATKFNDILSKNSIDGFINLLDNDNGLSIKITPTFDETHLEFLERVEPVVLNTDNDLKNLKRISSVLDLLPDPVETKIKGLIRELKTIADNEYKIKIYSNNLKRNIWITVGRNFFKKACDYYKNEEIVEITGKLEKNPDSNRWILSEPHKFIVQRNFDGILNDVKKAS